MDNKKIGFVRSRSDFMHSCRENVMGYLLLM